MRNLKVYFSWFSEVFVVIIALFVINNYLVRPEFFIKADGKGYYDYLPAAFIYKDLNFHFTDTLHTEYYDQKTYSSGYLHTVNGHQINKYFPGVAVLWTPFFAAAHWYALNSSDFEANGYSQPYQEGIFYAAIFYLFLGLFFLRKLLESYSISPFMIFLTQVSIVFATPLIHYVHFEPAFTHVYSFTLITAFVYFFRLYVLKNKADSLWIASILFGLILIVRPVNGLSIGLVFLAFGSFDSLKNWLNEQSQVYWKNWLLPIISSILVVSIVPFLWYYQTGSFLVWGYQNEGFNFAAPQFWPFLFSFQKGAFLLTPILLLAFLGGIWSWKKNHTIFWVWAAAAFLGVVLYVLSSWWAWWYGASFGSRPLIDFYVLFAVMLAFFYQSLSRMWAKIVTGLVVSLFLIVNLVQAIQYQTYIIDWSFMDFEKYKTIGFHTEQKYRGIFYRPSSEYHNDEVVFSIDYPIDNVELSSNESYYFPTRVLNDLSDSLRFNRIILESDLAFQDGSAQFILVLNNSSGENIYWHGEGVFGSALQENTRKLIRIPYRLEGISEVSELSIGIDSHSDVIKVYSLRIVGVFNE